jgi:hypothetical protein
VNRVRALVPTLAVVVLAACQPGASVDPRSASPAAELPRSVQPVVPPPPTPAASGNADEGATARDALSAWQTTRLTDVRSGERFAIADLAGKLVVVEPMAIWCTSCARQQTEASRALARLATDELVYISLDVDPTERAPDLAAYATDRGFDWRFVVADRRVSRSLAEDFGDQVLSPPSTPKIVVMPDGRVEGPHFGIQDAASMESELRDLLP